MARPSTPHVLAIGEALIDIVIAHDQPECPYEIPGGSPANVAVTLGRLGRPAALATWSGLDELGRLIGGLAGRFPHVDSARAPG